MPKTAQTPKKAMFLPPPRKTNAEVSTHEYLTATEIEQLCKVAHKQNRHLIMYRDELLVMLMFFHAFRVSEVISLRWDQVDLKEAVLDVKRIKNGKPATHPLYGAELCALRQLQRASSHYSLT